MHPGDGFWSYATDVPPGAGPLPEAGPPFAVGDLVGGRYEVQELLGRGGQANVYRASVRDGERSVALKVLTSVDPSAHGRLLREAWALASLRHPAVLRIHDALEHAGKLVLVLEFVAGIDWEGQLEFLDQEANLDTLAQVAAGLGEAHAAGLVHRDVKPANVLLADDGRPRVADFGLVRGLPAESLTQTGQLLGTPLYMSPEQLRGERVTSPAADVWALGVILYQVVTGELPFVGEGLLAQCVIVQEGAQALPVLGRGPLEAVWRRALDPEPAGRYPDAAAFAEALRTARAGGGPAVGRRWRSGGIGIGLLALVLAAGAGLAWTQRRADSAPIPASPSPAGSPPPSTPEPPSSRGSAPPPEATPTALRPWRTAYLEAYMRGDAAEALAAIDRCVELYGEFDDYACRCLLKAEVLNDKSGALQDARHALALQEDVTTDQMLTLARGLYAAGDHPSVVGIANQAIAGGEGQPLVYFLRGRSRLVMGDLAGEADLDRAISLNPEQSKASTMRLVRGQVRLEQGRAREALEDFDQVAPTEGTRALLSKLRARAQRLVDEQR